MEQITVKVYVDKAAALARCETKYGETTIEPTSEQLAELTNDERMWLCDAHPTRRMNVSRVDWASVVEATRAARVVEADREAQSALRAIAVQRDREANCAWGLALGLDPWFGGGVHTPPVILVPFWAEQLTQRPDVVAMHEAAKAELPRRTAIYEAAKATREAQIVADRKAREAKEAAYNADARAYLIATGSDYSRAARDGKNVGPQAFRHSMKMIRTVVAMATGAPAIVEELYAERERSVVKDHAYSVSDAAKKAIAHYEKESGYSVFSDKHITHAFSIVSACASPDEDAEHKTYVKISFSTAYGDGDYFAILAEEPG
ncbi:MAG: hypothetical protein ACHREM_01010 [Polyangiales bacterium]